MAFELMESKYKVAKLPDNMVSINKSAVSFGDNYANILLSNGRVCIYLDKENNKESQIITKLYPHSEDDFKQLASETGFKMESYGNLNKISFVAKESPNLVLVLTK